MIFEKKEIERELSLTKMRFGVRVGSAHNTQTNIESNVLLDRIFNSV